jgi:hypothetical protein
MFGLSKFQFKTRHQFVIANQQKFDVGRTQATQATQALLAESKRLKT